MPENFDQRVRKNITDFVGETKSYMTPQKKSILELGVGNIDENYNALREIAKEYIRTDVYKSDFAEEIIDIEQMDTTRYIVERRSGNRFDLVVCTEVLEHVYGTTAAITNIRNLLNKDGFVIITTPFMYPLHGDQDYWRFTHQSMTRMLEDIGFFVRVSKYGYVEDMTTNLFTLAQAV